VGICACRFRTEITSTMMAPQDSLLELEVHRLTGALEHLESSNAQLQEALQEAFDREFKTAIGEQAVAATAEPLRQRQLLCWTISLYRAAATRMQLSRVLRRDRSHPHCETCTCNGLAAPPAIMQCASQGSPQLCLTAAYAPACCRGQHSNHRQVPCQESSAAGGDTAAKGPGTCRAGP
jgi:hypothetical protein